MKVSVVIPTYNRPQLVGNAIQSVLDQTFDDFEIIVVDDGIERRAKDVVSRFNDDRIRYIEHQVNMGCSAAKNTGARESKGKYIAFLDDDDTWEPTKLEEQVEAMEAAPEAGFSFTAANETFNDRTYIHNTESGVNDYYELALRHFSAMIGSSLMYKKEVFGRVGYLDETLPTHTDVDFLIRVTKEYKGVGINKPLVNRIVEGEHEHMGTSIQRRIQGREMILKRYQNEFKEHGAFLAKHTERLAKFYRTAGDYKNARINFMISFRLQPRAVRLFHYVSMLFSGLLYRVVTAVTQ